MNQYEKFYEAENESQDFSTRIVDRIMFQISVLDTLNVAYKVLPTENRDVIYKKHMTEIKRIIDGKIEELQPEGN